MTPFLRCLVDAMLGEFFLTPIRRRVGEAPLERHELTPIDKRLSVNTFATQSPALIESLCNSDQNLLRSAPTERKSAAKRTMPTIAARQPAARQRNAAVVAPIGDCFEPSRKMT
jgi:hypothetical protein